jgi:membrane protease YdiL (CAAX protease family)
MKNNPTFQTSGVFYLLLSLLFTWSCWIPAAVLPANSSNLLQIALHYLGGAMPMIIAILFLFTSENNEVRKDYWQRIIDFRRIKPRWYLILLLIVPMFITIAIITSSFLVGSKTDFSSLQTKLQQPLSFLPFIFFIFMFGPLPEELAWRGYALDKLQSHWNPFRASLLLGIYWGFWHLPLFWIEGSYQNNLGVGTIQFWLFMLDKIPFTIIMTWLYNHSQRSVLATTLFHFMVNVCGELINFSLQGEIFYIIIWWLFTIILIFRWKPFQHILKININDISTRQHYLSRH